MTREERIKETMTKNILTRVSEELDEYEKLSEQFPRNTNLRNRVNELQRRFTKWTVIAGPRLMMEWERERDQ